MALKVFLDANVLFSAALGGSSFKLVWGLSERGTLELLTSRYCRLEAERNLSRKRPEARKHFDELLTQVREVPGVSSESMDEMLPKKDIPVYAAAVAVGADVLLTGDKKHFGALMARDDLPLRIRTVRDFLLEGRDFGARARAPTPHATSLSASSNNSQPLSMSSLETFKCGAIRITLL